MKKRIALLLAMLFCFVVAFTGCGEKQNNKPNNGKESSNTGEKEDTNKTTDEDNKGEKKDENGNTIYEAANPESMPAVDREGTLIVGTKAPSGNMCPYYTNSAYDFSVWAIMFNDLFDVNETGLPENGKGMATWDISKDGKTMNLALKKGIKFWDGEELNADDVMWTFKFISDPQYPGILDISSSGIVGLKEYMNEEPDENGKYSITEIEGMKKIDDYNIEISFEEPNREAIYDLGIPIMPEHYYGTKYEKGKLEYIAEEFSRKPLGSGAYKLENINDGQEISFIANENYWKGAPKIPKIIYKYVEDDTSLQEFLAGNIDFTQSINLTGDNLQELQATGFPSYILSVYAGYGYIGMNNTRPNLSDPKVRLALIHATNREAVIENVFGEHAKPINVVQAPTHPAYPKEHIAYEYDLEKANKLLDEAGWEKKDDGFRYKDGKKLSMTFYATPNNDVLDALIPTITEDWKAVGIDLSSEQIEFNTVLERTSPKVRDYDLYFMASSISTNPNVEYSYSTEGQGNRSGFSNAELDGLMIDVRKEMDDKKANEMYARGIQIVNENAPIMPIYQRMDLSVYNPRVKNLKIGMYYRWYYDIHEIELAK